MNRQRLNILEEFKSVQGKGETFNFITMLMESLLMSQGLNIKTIVMDGNLYLKTSLLQETFTTFLIFS